MAELENVIILKKIFHTQGYFYLKHNTNRNYYSAAGVQIDPYFSEFLMEVCEVPMVRGGGVESIFPRSVLERVENLFQSFFIKNTQNTNTKHINNSQRQQ